MMLESWFIPSNVANGISRFSGTHATTSRGHRNSARHNGNGNSSSSSSSSSTKSVFSVLELKPPAMRRDNKLAINQCTCFMFLIMPQQRILDWVWLRYCNIGSGIFMAVGQSPPRRHPKVAQLVAI